MAMGPGKYDQDLEQLMEQHSALAGFLILVSKKHHGASCKVTMLSTHTVEEVMNMHKAFIMLLRRVADEMEAELPEIRAEVENESCN